MITKNEIETIIDKLADKTLSLGCRYVYKNDIRSFCDSDHYKNAEVVVREKIDVKDIKILGHPVLIGDCLAKMKEKHSLSVCKMLLNFWEPCGLDKSLQQIVEESGYYYKHGFHDEVEGWVDGIEYLKSKEAESLFGFLKGIFT